MVKCGNIVGVKCLLCRAHGVADNYARKHHSCRYQKQSSYCCLQSSSPSSNLLCRKINLKGVLFSRLFLFWIYIKNCNKRLTGQLWFSPLTASRHLKPFSLTFYLLDACFSAGGVVEDAGAAVGAVSGFSVGAWFWGALDSICIFSAIGCRRSGGG